MQTVGNAQTQMSRFPRGVLQLQWTSQTGVFLFPRARVSTPQVGPVQTEQELQESDSDSPTELDR